MPEGMVSLDLDGSSFDGEENAGKEEEGGGEEAGLSDPVTDNGDIITPRPSLAAATGAATNNKAPAEASSGSPKRGKKAGKGTHEPWSKYIKNYEHFFEVRFWHKVLDVKP